MDNGQIPPVQPISPVQPGSASSVGMPMVQQVQVLPEKKKDVAGLVKTIVIVAASLIAVTFIGLFIWMFTQYNDVREDVEGKISIAVANAKDEQAMEDEAEFLKREKQQYRPFSGPADYGQLTFQYSKTWSVYIGENASSGGDFEAYFNPGQVDPISDDTINALRVSIIGKSYDNVVAEYQGNVESEDSNLKVESVIIGNLEKNEIVANKYTGTIPGTELKGIIVIFKIRDKTAILQTDSMTFEDDFNTLLTTVEFNA